MLTGQTADKELIENSGITPLQTNNYFSPFQELNQLEFFQLVYLANFIEPVKIFNDGNSNAGQLNITEVKKLI